MPALTLLVVLTIAVVGTTHSLIPVTRQIEVVHNARTVTIIVTEDVAARVMTGNATDADREAVAVAVELALGHVGPPTHNPCHKPDAGGPHLHDAGRLPNNCSEESDP
jgi:hypothetical protein